MALLKLLDGVPARDSRREQHVRDHYASVLGPAGWSATALDDWLTTLLQASLDVQARLRVAYQGAPGSWSDESLARLLPAVERVPVESFADAWSLVRNGSAAAAWIPVENSTIGPIYDTLEIQAAADAWLECEYPVQHVLLARPQAQLHQIRRVEGHPRAIDQCRASLARWVPHAEVVATVDGAHSSRSGVVPEAAVIGSPRLRSKDLEIVVPNLCDQENNRTRFRLLVLREPV